MMIDGQYCTCGGYFEHVDTEIDNDKVTDSYQCDGCETWCIVVWDEATEKEIERRYEKVTDEPPAL